MRAAIFALLLFVHWDFAIAQTSGGIDPRLTSDEAIAKAQSDIGLMSEAELRSLLNYLVECNDRLTSSEITLRSCRAALLKYQTEFRSGRAIDGVLEEIEKISAVQRAIRNTGISPNPAFINSVEMKLREAIGFTLRVKTRTSG